MTQDGLQGDGEPPDGHARGAAYGPATARLPSARTLPTSRDAQAARLSTGAVPPWWPSPSRLPWRTPTRQASLAPAGNAVCCWLPALEAAVWHCALAGVIRLQASCKSMLLPELVVSSSHTSCSQAG